MWCFRQAESSSRKNLGCWDHDCSIKSTTNSKPLLLVASPLCLHCQDAHPPHILFQTVPQPPLPPRVGLTVAPSLPPEQQTAPLTHLPTAPHTQLQTVLLVQPRAVIAPHTLPPQVVLTAPPIPWPREQSAAPPTPTHQVCPATAQWQAASRSHSLPPNCVPLRWTSMAPACPCWTKARTCCRTCWTLILEIQD